MDKRLLSITVVIALFFVLVQPLYSITWTTVDYPGAHLTFIGGIDGSNIVGFRSSFGDSGHFLYDGTTWTTLNLPAGTGVVTGVSGDNIVGWYVSSGSFLYNWTTNITLDFPNAYISGIDGSNVVGGANGHGFIYNLDSQTWSTLDYSGAVGTAISGIDGKNIVGRYWDASGTYGFLYDGTTWTILDLPVPGDIAGISGSNIVTSYGIYNLESKVFTTLHFPGSAITQVYGIDGDKIVGQYLASGVKHGFIAIIPEPASALLIIIGAGLLRRRR